MAQYSVLLGSVASWMEDRDSRCHPESQQPVLTCRVPQYKLHTLPVQGFGVNDIAWYLRWDPDRPRPKWRHQKLISRPPPHRPLQQAPGTAGGQKGSCLTCSGLWEGLQQAGPRWMPQATPRFGGFAGLGVHSFQFFVGPFSTPKIEVGLHIFKWCRPTSNFCRPIFISQKKCRPICNPRPVGQFSTLSVSQLTVPLNIVLWYWVVSWTSVANGSSIFNSTDLAVVIPNSSV